MNASDPFEVLRTHVRSTTSDVPPRISDADLVDAITNGRYAPATITTTGDFVPRRRPRRRHRVAIGVAVALAASGGFAVAASNWDQKASRPERGASCYSAFSMLSSQLALPNSVDPLGDCAEMWRSGRLNLSDGSVPPGAVPALVACVSKQNVVVVFPSTDDRGCGSLGLPNAIVSGEVDPVAELAHRLVDEVNATCLPFEAAQQETEKILHSLRLSGWKIVDLGGMGACSYASADGDVRVVTLSLLPPFPPATN